MVYESFYLHNHGICVYATQQVIFVVFTPALMFANLAQSVTFEDLISWYVIFLIYSALVARRVSFARRASFVLRLFLMLIKLVVGNENGLGTIDNLLI